MSINNALNPKTSALRVEWDFSTSSISDTDIILVKNTVDLEKVFSYLDEWTDDERVSNIVYSSPSQSLSFTETFTYWWVAWAYRVTNITTS